MHDALPTFAPWVLLVLALAGFVLADREWELVLAFVCFGLALFAIL